MKLQINITKDVLRESMYCDADYGESCPIAVAIRSIFPHAWVYPFGIDPFQKFYLDFEEERDEFNLYKYGIPLPEEAEEFVNEFDELVAGERIELPELSFQIEIPESVIDKINISDLQNCPTLKLIES